MVFFVYIIESPVYSKFYVGQTRNLDDRLQRHNNGSESATAPYAPWHLKWHTKKATRSEAVILETKLKNLSRSRLLRFIKKYGEYQSGS